MSSSSNRVRTCGMMLERVNLAPDMRARALAAFVRADVITDFIIEVVRASRKVLRSYERHAGYVHPHPSHE